MRTTPLFVTPSDFENMTGINLQEFLKPNDNRSNAANLFLMNIEDSIASFISSNTYQLYAFDPNKLFPRQVELVQRAIITQAEYVLRNSDISTDSGYDPSKGKYMDYSDLVKIEICNKKRKL